MDTISNSKKLSTTDAIIGTAIKSVKNTINGASIT